MEGGCHDPKFRHIVTWVAPQSSDRNLVVVTHPGVDEGVVRLTPVGMTLVGVGGRTLALGLKWTRSHVRMATSQGGTKWFRN